MFSWSIFILFVAALALQVSAALQTSFSSTLPGAAVPTPFVGSTMSQCMRSCIRNAADANHCDAARTCVCMDPNFQQAVAVCLQSKCSFTQEEAVLQLQLQHGTKCYREILEDGVQTSPAGQQAGSNHNQGNNILSNALRLEEFGCGFAAAALTVGLILWA